MELSDLDDKIMLSILVVVEIRAVKVGKHGKVEVERSKRQAPDPCFEITAAGAARSANVPPR